MASSRPFPVPRCNFWTKIVTSPRFVTSEVSLTWKKQVASAFMLVLRLDFLTAQPVEGRCQASTAASRATRAGRRAPLASSSSRSRRTTSALDSAVDMAERRWSPFFVRIFSGFVFGCINTDFAMKAALLSVFSALHFYVYPSNI